MKNKKVVSKLVSRSETGIQAVCDVLNNAKTKMITIDFKKVNGIIRTINGMLLPTREGLAKQGMFNIKENTIIRNSRGQCKTIATNHRIVNLSTASRIAFNKVVYNFV
jgi:hypothetical protein